MLYAGLDIFTLFNVTLSEIGCLSQNNKEIFQLQTLNHSSNKTEYHHHRAVLADIQIQDSISELNEKSQLVHV